MMISIKTLLIIILVAGYLLDLVLDIINLRNTRTEIPDEMSGYYDEEKYRKSQAYQRTVTRFGFLTGAMSIVTTLAMIVFGGFGWVDGFFRPYTDNPILLALFFFGSLYIVSDLLTIPFQYYRNFVIEEKFGFNQMSIKTFITDKFKGYLIAAVIGGILITILVYLLELMGSDFWWVFWIVITALMLLVNLFYTTLLLPLFNKLTPLEDGELLTAIRKYCQEVNFPIKNVFVIDGSKRSKKSNAFFSGFGRQKKVVLYDTLIENHSQDELVAILAHEVGHYKKKHIIWGLATGIIQSGAILFILSRFIFSEDLSIALGGSEPAIHLNLIAFFLLFSPVSTILGIITNIFSRKHEYEADAFAASTYRAQPMMEALKKLSVDNLSNLFPHPAYVFVHYSHPPLLRRLAAIRLAAKPTYES